MPPQHHPQDWRLPTVQDRKDVDLFDDVATVDGGVRRSPRLDLLAERSQIVGATENVISPSTRSSNGAVSSGIFAGIMALSTSEL